MENIILGEKIDFKTKAKTWCICWAEGPMGQSCSLWDYDWTPLSQNSTQVEVCSATGASDSQSPAIPTSGPPPTTLGAWHGVPCPGTGLGSSAESSSSWDMGSLQKGGHPLAWHAPHIHAEPGAKPFLVDLLLGGGFFCSRATPFLRPIFDTRVCRGKKEIEIKKR